ncbi:acetyl-CoA synthetase-like protein [Calocera cornea HHB12733]|uniref:Acetyl-CoA synthetase-like protein n=1 Tax=Calocera cornea HHB12733 TaxID=1353952 RepID=A0A165G0B7_9BASI|nr:acetyl-CoA synthetase-like protein [Calocera cornea HHB12733]
MVHYSFPLPRPVEFRRQSAEVPFTKKPAQTGHYRNTAQPELITIDSPDLPFKTVPAILDYALKRYPNNYRWLGHLPVTKPATKESPVEYASEYKWITYAEGAKRRKDIGSGIELLYEAGLVGKNDQGLETVGIWTKNCPEWQLVDNALMCFGRCSVALYDTLGPDAVEYVINHAGLQLAFVSQNHLEALVSLGREKCPCLKVLVCVDDPHPTSLGSFEKWGNEKGIKIMSLVSLEKLGRENPREFRYPKPEAVATISYTSGTTGRPKGVVITHANMVTSIYAWLVGACGDAPNNALVLSVLPLAHVFERGMELTGVAQGFAIGFSTGDPLRLLEDARLLKPWIMTAVPRILNRLYMALQPAYTDPGFKGRLFRRAVTEKLANLHKTGSVTHPFWDRLVFRKVQALLGGQLHLVPNGAAPMSGEVLDFLKVVFGSEMPQGYGMTESTGAAISSYELDPLPGGCIGRPVGVNEIKLVDVPEMGYRATDVPNPRGEICLRGANVTSGYYRGTCLSPPSGTLPGANAPTDEATTRAAIDADGWLHSGDIGTIDGYGRVRIIDRVKNIVKLAQGEYVALEKVEAAYAVLPLVQQLFVHGEGTQSYTVGVLVPDPAAFAALASGVLGREVQATDAEGLAKAAADERVVSAIMAVLNRQAEQERLKGFERVKRVHVAMEPFSIENGILTATFKVKRMAALERYRKQIDELYALGEPAKAAKAPAIAGPKL